MFGTKQDWKLGDKPWIYLAHHHGERHQGKIVHTFSVGGQELFVVEIETAIDPGYEVRNFYSMWSEQAKGYE